MRIVKQILICLNPFSQVLRSHWDISTQFSVNSCCPNPFSQVLRSHNTLLRLNQVDGDLVLIPSHRSFVLTVEVKGNKHRKLGLNPFSQVIRSHQTNPPVGYDLEDMRLNPFSQVIRSHERDGVRRYKSVKEGLNPFSQVIHSFSQAIPFSM